MNNLFYKHQCGLRPNASTDIAVIELLNEIYLKVDRGDIISGLFFRYIDHKILIEKLQYACVRGISLSLIKNY